jgi:rSAM/selenodomain-associated transferase 1
MPTTSIPILFKLWLPLIDDGPAERNKRWIMRTVAIAVMCKTPIAGASKTRLSPPLHPEECAVISGCFISDLSSTIVTLASDGDIAPYAVYTPSGTEKALRQLLPNGCNLVLQAEGDFGVRLLQGIQDLLGKGHAGAILVNSDSPTLPRAILRQAADAVLRGDNVTLSPALDGGYTLIGLSRAHARLFEEIPWSTSDVYRLTLERAREIGLPVETVAGWYDVDDASSLQILEDELSGQNVTFASQSLSGANAPATRRFVRERQSRLVESF